MNEKLKKLLEQRNSLIAQMRTLADKDSLSKEENETYVRFEGELSNTEVSIKRQEDLAKAEATLREVVETPQFEAPEEGKRDFDKKSDDAKRYTDAFENYIRKPLDFMDQATRAILNTGTGSEGGYTVPVVYMTTVIEKLLDQSVMRQNSTVVRTTSTTKIPLGETDPVFEIIAESGAYPVVDITFGQKEMDAFKVGGIIKSSDELLNDSFLNLEQYITGKIVRGMGTKEETLFTTGTGTAQPEGIITGATLGNTTVAIAAVTADEVLTFLASVKAVYRKNGKVMMNSQTQLALRKLKDTAGQYLWQASLILGAPATFDGQEIVINEDMADLGTGNKFMGFGDMSYYQIADRGQMEIKRLDELYAGNGQIGFRTNKRCDAKLLLAEAYKYMANA